MIEARGELESSKIKTDAMKKRLQVDIQLSHRVSRFKGHNWFEQNPMPDARGPSGSNVGF